LAQRKSSIYDREQYKYGKVLPTISHLCGGGCPVSLALPQYPSEARRLKIFGQVKVEAVVDEQGKVVYARVLEGNPFLRYNARVAACRSMFTSLEVCDGRAVKFRRIIIYNFILN
jgi:TonB family protein